MRRSIKIFCSLCLLISLFFVVLIARAHREEERVRKEIATSTLFQFIEQDGRNYRHWATYPQEWVPARQIGTLTLNADGTHSGLIYGQPCVVRKLK